MGDENNFDLSIPYILGVVKPYIIKIASQIAGTTITDITYNSATHAFVFTFTNGTSTAVVVDGVMSESKYVNSTGDGTVRNSGLLNGKTESYYTNSINSGFDHTLTTFVSTNMQDLGVEIFGKLKAIRDQVTTLTSTQNAHNNTISAHTSQINSIDARLTTTETETQTNNVAIADLIRGAFLTTKGKIQLIKDTKGVTIDSTAIQGDINVVSDDLILHKTSSTAHFGVLETKSDKGAINGYPPLDSNLKIPINFLYTNAPTTAITTYPTNVVTTIANPQSNKYYYERANSKTDSRYPTNEVALTSVIPSATTAYADVGSGLIDAGVLVGTFNNLTALSFMRYKCDMAGAKLRLEFYKRTSAGVETKIATSVEVNVQQSATFVSLETQSLFQSFSMTATDKIAIKWTVLKPIIGVLTFVTAVGGQSPTYTSFVSTNGTGGSTTPVGVNDVIGLPQIFNGDTAIGDLKISTQTYKLKDFMNFAQITNPNSIYVSSGSSNGTGDRFTPFGTLTYALAATSDTRKDIEIMDIGSYALPVNPDTTKVDNFMAHRAIITGDLVVSKSGSMYRIGTLNGNLKANAPNATIMIDKMVGNIEISSNCVIVISGSFNGTITVVGNITPYIRINKVITTMTQPQIEALKPKVEAGSVFGKYIFNMVAII